MTTLSISPPDSPFLPDTNLQFAWDSTSLSNALACPRRYQLMNIQGWTSKLPSQAIALDFGILFHSGLEIYYKARAADLSHEAAQETMVWELVHTDKHSSRLARIPTEAEIEAQEAEAKLGSSDPATADAGWDLRNSKIRTRYHLFRALIWYTEHYGRDDPFQTLVVNSEPAVEVSFRVETPCEIAGNPVIYCGHIDRAIEFNDHLYVTDYKTCKGLSRQFFEGFDISHQFTGYTFAGQVIFDRPVSGAYVDGIALQVEGVQFGRHLTTRTPGQFQEFFDVLQFAADTMERCFDLDYYPMNTSACMFCEYKGICRLPPEIRSSELSLLFKQVNLWNPLENR